MITSIGFGIGGRICIYAELSKYVNFESNDWLPGQVGTMRRKPKVAIIIGSDFMGSPERMILKQMKYLTGFDFVGASFVRKGNKNAFLESVQNRGYRAERIDENFIVDPKIPSRIRALIENNGIDLIITHGYKANLYTVLSGISRRIPHIAYFHGWTREDLKIRFYNSIDRFALRRIKSIVTVSLANADRLAMIGVPKERIKVVYNAIELDRVESVNDASVSERPIIGVVGRLSFEKGLHNFINALAGIVGEAGDFTAEIYGRGTELENLKKLASELSLDDIVRFMGFADDMDRVYRRLDFLVIPSLSEGHPLVILEAWKHKLGIIAACVGGIPEVIDHGIDGILVDSNDHVKLGAAILEGLRNKERMKTLGNAGYSKLKSKYSYEIQAARLSEIINALLERDFRQGKAI